MRSSYLGVTKWQTRSAHSSAETERQNLGGLLDSCFGNLGLFESAAGTVRSCSALAGTPADLVTDEAAPHRFFDLKGVYSELIDLFVSVSQDVVA